LPVTISEAQMASTDVRSTVLVVLSIAIICGAVYLVDPTIFGILPRNEGFASGSTMGTDSNGSQPAGMQELAGQLQKMIEKNNVNSAGGDMKSSDAAMKNTPEMPMQQQMPMQMQMPKAPKPKAVGQITDASGEGFADLEDTTGPAAFDSSEGPAGCYPRDQLTPAELLPKDGNSVWAQQNPMGTGSLKGKNFLSAGALIGVNTVGQTLRNANLQLRSEPPNPQVPVSVFYNSTIQPDTNRRDLEIE
jgi:hypothetical protein